MRFRTLPGLTPVAHVGWLLLAPTLARIPVFQVRL